MNLNQRLGRRALGALTLLTIMNLRASHVSAQSPQMFVNANVYQENPATTPTPVQRLLIVYEPGSSLQSDYVSVNSSVTGTAPTWYTAAPNGPDRLRFLQANAYHHAYRFIQYKLAPNGLDYFQTPIQLSISLENAGIVVPGSTTASIGGVNAEDADIIVHETFHAFLNTQIPVRTTSQYAVGGALEAGGLDEGLADYSAAIMNGNTLMGEWANGGGGYNIDTDPAVFHYSRINTFGLDKYAIGRILNGALIDLRKPTSIGPVVDDVVYQAIVFYKPVMGFRAFLDAMLAVDYDGWEGAHVAAIKSAFATRGILPSPPENIQIHGQTAQFAGEAGSYSVSLASGIGPFQYIWLFKPGPFYPWFETGDGTNSIQFTASTDYTWKVRVVDREGSTFDSPEFNVDVVSHAAYQAPSGLVINGPTELMVGAQATYSAQLTGGQGAGVLTYSWTTSEATIPVQGQSQMLGFSTGPAQAFVTVTDGFGNTASASLAITLTSGGLDDFVISGPDDIAPGEIATYTASVSGGVPPYTFAWTQIGGGGGSLGTGVQVQNHPSDTDFRLRVIVTDSQGDGLVNFLDVVVHGGTARREDPGDDENSTAARPRFALAPNSPNPFNPTTQIAFEIPGEAHTRLEVFDATGHRVATLVDAQLSAGPHRVAWKGRDDRGNPVSAGVYWYRLESAGKSEARRMVLLK